jgi:RNA polymerase sigma factor (TIGR02999 family)
MFGIHAGGRVEAFGTQTQSSTPMNDLSDPLATVDLCDARAAEQLLPLVYDELRRLAAQRLARERPGQTLQATALVNEAYLRLVAHEAMRRILVENARRKGREKHGGGRQRVHEDLDALDAGESPSDILALHEALTEFALHDPLKAKLVELRFFGGLTLAEAAECLEVSLSTADRAWRFARAWLYAAMAGSDSSEKSGTA